MEQEATNELLVVECKSYLDSGGVAFANGVFGRGKEPGKGRYKLFNDESLREVVFQRLSLDLVEHGYCRNGVKPALCLSAGKLTRSSDPDAIRAHLRSIHPAAELFDRTWIKNQ